MNRVAVVTGGSRGIGAAIAVELAKAGFNVAFTYNKSLAHAADVLKKVKKYSPTSNCYKCDVSDNNNVKNIFEKIMLEFGHVDVLVNNAGISHEGLFTDTDENDWNKVFDVNVKGVFNCTQAVLPQMIKRKSGNIINISSVWGQVGASCEVIYSASKAAVIGFTKALAKEVAPCKINVNCICPGVIMTDMISDFTEEELTSLKEQTPMNVIGKPEDIANAVIFLSSEKASFVTGQIISVNGGFSIT